MWLLSSFVYSKASMRPVVRDNLAVFGLINIPANYFLSVNNKEIIK